VTMNDFTGDGLVDYGENLPPFRPVRALAIPGASGSYNVPGPPNNNPTLFPRWVENTGANDPTWYTVGSRVFPPVSAGQRGDPFYYICVGTDDLNSDGTIAHSATPGSVAWPRTAGLKVQDGDLIWQAVDNRKPLRAIQITLRFLDPSTGQLRTMTLQHSLVE
jgi:hypothetical protein